MPPAWSAGRDRPKVAVGIHRLAATVARAVKHTVAGTQQQAMFPVGDADVKARTPLRHMIYR